ncbi:hypothetical protein NDU88_003321 [Pleurodeles waltl]|uniref:Uncharacterized protein n=1 Tax=Pleurodeles waltl TaxID=8319 RepID=A0AAV7VH38_PLEWA|nr:hypothetical protein NDU88_003321 [Pleurodeles waltl]
MLVRSQGPSLLHTVWAQSTAGSASLSHLLLSKGEGDSAMPQACPLQREVANRQRWGVVGGHPNTANATASSHEVGGPGVGVAAPSFLVITFTRPICHHPPGPAPISLPMRLLLLIPCGPCQPWCQEACLPHQQSPFMAKFTGPRGP